MRALHPRSLAILTGLLVLSVGWAGCRGEKIREEHATVFPQSLSVLTPTQTLKIERIADVNQKFHASIRISEQFLNDAAARMLDAEVVPSRFESPVAMSIPPFGTKLVLKPGVDIKNPRLSFSPACDTCVTISSHFVGRLALDVNLSSGSAASTWFDSAPMSGDVTLRGKLIPLYTGGIPSLGLQLDPLADSDLVVETNVPVPGMDSLVTSAVRSQMRAALASSRVNTFALVPLRSLVIPGSRLAVNGLSYRLNRDGTPELFIGVLFNLSTPPEVDIASRGKPLRARAFAAQIGEKTLTDVLRVWLAEGLLPAVYDVEGNPDPAGPVTVELKRLALFEDRYEAYTRFWHIGKPTFWREYRLTGILGVRSEAVSIRNDKAEILDKAGPNALIDAALATQKISLKRALEGIGSKAPRQVNFPFGAPSRLTAQIVLDELQTENARMTLFGAVDFTKVAPVPPAPASPTTPTH